MKYLKIIFIIKITLLLVSCGVVREGFSNQKKNNSDEFLVEKKKPLVMPPNYDELPKPKTNQQPSKEAINPIKSLLVQETESLNNKEIVDKDKKLEESLLEKIKKN